MVLDYQCVTRMPVASSRKRVLSVVTCCKRIIVKLVATLTIMSMSVSCSKENSAGFIWLLSESGTVDYSAQDVQLRYKVILDNGSSVSVTTDADWIKIGTPGESYATLSVSRNDSRKESRTAEITVGYGDMAPLTYTLTQGYLRPEIVLSRLSESVDCQAQEIFVPCEILNPIDGEEFNAETEQEWFEIILEQERGGIRLQIPENATAEDRVAEITFTYEYAETKTLALVQKTVKEYEVINGIKWAVNNCGDPSSPLGSYYNWKERETACPDGWRPATSKEMEKLFYYGSAWTSHNGVSGRWYSGMNKYAENVPQIFLPAAGGCWFGKFREVGQCGYYWTDALFNSGDNASGYGVKDYAIQIGVGLSTRDNSRYSLRCVQDLLSV